MKKALSPQSFTRTAFCPCHLGWERRTGRRTLTIVKVKSNATSSFDQILHPREVQVSPQTCGKQPRHYPSLPTESETQSSEEASETRGTCVFSVSYATWDCSGAEQWLFVQKPECGTLQDDGGDRKVVEAQEFKLTSICYLSSGQICWLAHGRSPCAKERRCWTTTDHGGRLQAPVCGLQRRVSLRELSRMTRFNSSGVNKMWARAVWIYI